jgi:hypothetical protein
MKESFACSLAEARAVAGVGRTSLYWRSAQATCGRLKLGGGLSSSRVICNAGWKGCPLSYRNKPRLLKRPQVRLVAEFVSSRSRTDLPKWATGART